MRDRSPVATGVLIALSVIGILLGLWFLNKIQSIVVIVLIAIIVATGIGPLVDRMMRIRFPPGSWHLPKGIAILLVFLGVFIVIGGIVTLVGSVVVTEAIQLSQNAPRYFSVARDAFIGLQEKYTFLPDIADIVDRLRNQIGTISSYVYRAASGLVGFLGNILVFITVFVLTYYMLQAKKSIKSGFLRLIPPAHRDKYGHTFSEMGEKMGGWLRAQLLLAFIVGASIVVFLLIIVVPYAYIIGIIGAVAELIPLLGPMVAAIPAVLLTLFQPTWQLVLVIIFFVVLAQIEGNYLAPRIMQKKVGLSPLITILALLVGGTLAGMIGALLAIPLAAAIQVFVKHIVIPAIEEKESTSDD